MSFVRLRPAHYPLMTTFGGNFGGPPRDGMVPWVILPEYDRWALVAYLESLSSGFAHKPRAPGINTTTPPAETSQLVGRGQKMFMDAGCIESHGRLGMGDGPSSSTLIDAAGLPARPIDFSSGVFRRGSSMKDIFITLRTGLDGTPMPSYADSLTADQTWAVAAYVRSLMVKSKPSKRVPLSPVAGEARRQERMGLMIDMPGMERIPMCRLPRSK